MDFKNNRKDIRDLVNKVEVEPGGGRVHNLRGVYILQRDPSTRHYKIGMSVDGLYNRLSSYATMCFPFEDEYYLHYLIISPRRSDETEYRRVVKKLEDKFIDIEKTDFKSMLKSDKNQGRSTKEYKTISSTTVLKDTVFRVLNANKTLWTHLIVFGDDGWQIHKCPKRTGSLKKFNIPNSSERNGINGSFVSKEFTWDFKHGDARKKGKKGIIISTKYKEKGKTIKGTGEITIIYANQKDCQIKFKAPGEPTTVLRVNNFYNFKTNQRIR